MSQEREFETYLQGKSDLSRQYAESPQVELPDHLDAAILAEAHRAVGSRPGAKPRRRWAIPLSMVATLFLVVMAGLQLPYLLKDAALSQAPREERPAVAATETNAKPAAALADEGRKSQPMAKARSEAAPGAPAPMPFAEPAPAAQNAPKPGVILQPPGAEARMSRDAVAAPPVAAAPQAPAPAAKRLGEAAEIGLGVALSREKKAVAPAESNVGDAAPAAADMAAPAPARESGQAQSLKDEGGANLNPEEWLIRIGRLKQAGKPDEAKRELAAFRKRYPDYPVPKELEVR